MGCRKGAPRKVVAADVRQRAWVAMRVHREFTVPEILATSGASYDNLRRFVRQLENTGYLLRLESNQSGHAGSSSRFRLIRDTGPKVRLSSGRESGMYDPNGDQVFPAAGKGGR